MDANDVAAFAENMIAKNRASHAYEHWVGKIIGIKVDGKGIVPATVTAYEINQDDNHVLVATDDGEWHTVRAMDTYRKDFINDVI